MLTQVHLEEDDTAGHSQVFDVHPLTSVGLDTYVQLTDLSLVHGATYYVMVIAVDESGGCVETSDSVTVDTTPPQSGQIGVGPDTDMVSCFGYQFQTFSYSNYFSNLITCAKNGNAYFIELYKMLFELRWPCDKAVHFNKK